MRRQNQVSLCATWRPTTSAICTVKIATAKMTANANRRCVDVAERGSANRIYVMTARNILGWVLALAFTDGVKDVRS